MASPTIHKSSRPHSTTVDTHETLCIEARTVPLGGAGLCKRCACERAALMSHITGPKPHEGARAVAPHACSSAAAAPQLGPFSASSLQEHHSVVNATYHDPAASAAGSPIDERRRAHRGRFIHPPPPRPPPCGRAPPGGPPPVRSPWAWTINPTMHVRRRRAACGDYRARGGSVGVRGAGHGWRSDAYR